MNGAARVAALERVLGDPFDPANPLGPAATLAADENEVPFAAAETTLDDFGLNAEFVPVAHGGRLADLGTLTTLLRSIHRRDPALALGYGFSSFIASVNVWLAGDGAQRDRAAGLLLSNRRIAAAYHELAHGNDMAGTAFRVTDRGGIPVLRGRKEVVTNARRADALVIFARTADRPGSRSHAQVFVEKSELEPARFGYLPRYPTSGMRSVQLGGITFDDCPLPPDGILGVPGGGLETALRSFQITRALAPAMMIGAVDTALRITLRHLCGRRLYGRTAAALPPVRSALAGVFADLLLADCLTRTVVRALHLLPAQGSVLAAVSKHLAAKVLLDSMNTLAALLGAQSYLRNGENAVFQKLLRDVQPIGFAHAARAACESTALPQLPRLARRAWRRPRPAPAALFRLNGPLSPFRFEELALTSAGDDVTGSLPELIEWCLADPERAEIGRLGAEFATVLSRVADDIERLPPGALAVDGPAHAGDLFGRYGLVVAATAALGVWRHSGQPAPPDWIHAVLTRLADRLRGRPQPLPEAPAEALFGQLHRRFTEGRSFDMDDRAIPDGTAAR